jgi:hypothetical protein
MKGAATGSKGVKRPTDRPAERTVSPFMKATAVAELLRQRHGEGNARKVALTEQRKARRARSKRRFAFWAEVAARIKNENCNNAENTRGATGPL